MLNHLRQIDLDNNSLKQLTLKTVILLALLSGQRIQTLHVLKTTNIYIENSELEFHIDCLLKQTKPGKHLSSICFSKIY